MRYHQKKTLIKSMARLLSTMNKSNSDLGHCSGACIYVHQTKRVDFLVDIQGLTEENKSINRCAY